MESGKIVFFGTSEICLPFLEVLKNKFEIQLIIPRKILFKKEINLSKQKKKEV